MNEKNGTHEATAIYSFGRSACPKIRNSHQRMCRANNAGSILFQSGTPFLFRHGDRFGNITGPPVRICNLIECTFRSLPLQAIACNYIRNSLRRLIGFRIHKPIMRSHHNLLCSVPDMKFFFRYRMNTYTMYPSDIIIRCLNAIPTVAL